MYSRTFHFIWAWFHRKPCGGGNSVLSVLHNQRLPTVRGRKSAEILLDQKNNIYVCLFNDVLENFLVLRKQKCAFNESKPGVPRCGCLVLTLAGPGSSGAGGVLLRLAGLCSAGPCSWLSASGPGLCKGCAAPQAAGRTVLLQVPPGLQVGCLLMMPLENRFYSY